MGKIFMGILAMTVLMQNGGWMQEIKPAEITGENTEGIVYFEADVIQCKECHQLSAHHKEANELDWIAAKSPKCVHHENGNDFYYVKEIIHTYECDQCNEVFKEIQTIDRRVVCVGFDDTETE